MDAKQLFFERYRGYQEYPPLLVSGMSEQQLRHSPHPALNPVSWILWHTARCEDMAVNRLIADRQQVLDDGSWATRIGVSLRQIGTGMTGEEVGDLCERLNLSELVAYREAVTERTEEAVTRLPVKELSEELTVQMLRKVLVEEGAGGSAAESIAGMYRGNTKGWLLGHLALTHSYYHIGQAFAVRRMYGLPTPW
jgi:hypothetical protein